MGFFSSKSTTTNPLDLYTPEQRKSVLALQSLASTGSGGGITLGEGFEGSLGNFQQTAGEQQALAGLQGLISGDALKTAESTFTDLANTEFDPSDPKSGYAAFSRALAKSGGESQDLINREAARTGGAFGSGRGRDTADLAENLANQRGSFLSNLYQNSRQQQLAGAQGLSNLSGQQANLFKQLEGQAAVERQLKDQEATRKYTEFQRARGEELKRLGLMQNELNNPMAPKTITSPSMFSKLAPLLGTVAGFAIGGPAGASIGGSLGSAVGGATSPSGTPQASGGGFDLSSLFGSSGGFSSGNVAGTGFFGGKLGGKTQSEILGFNTSQYRS